MSKDRASAQAPIWAEGELPPRPAETKGSEPVPKSPARPGGGI